MIPNSHTNESVHVANYLLHGGAIDPAAMYEAAKVQATKIAKRCRQDRPEWSDDDYDDFWQSEFENEFVYAVEQAFYSAINEAIPDADLDCEGFAWIDFLGATEGDYENTSWMVLALLSTIVDRINFYSVAAIISEHVAKSLTPA